MNTLSSDCTCEVYHSRSFRLQRSSRRSWNWLWDCNRPKGSDVMVHDRPTRAGLYPPRGKCPYFQPVIGVVVQRQTSDGLRPSCSMQYVVCSPSPWMNSMVRCTVSELFSSTSKTLGTGSEQERSALPPLPSICEVASHVCVSGQSPGCYLW